MSIITNQTNNFEENNQNILVVYQLPRLKENDNILDENTKPSFSVFPNMPNFKYGFYFYIFQTKNKMEIFESDKKVRDFHKIVNAFEDTVPNDEPIKQYKSDKIKSSDDINTFSIKYFNSDRIISRAFYKLWELIMMFPLIDDKAKNITSIHIAEAPGSFAQSVIYYRNKFFNSTDTKGDTYIATSIQPQKKSSEYVPSFNHDLTNNKQFKHWFYKDSDLTKLDIIDKFVSDNKNNKADFITADGGFNWKDENFQEQEAYLLLLSEIYCALKVQKKGGSFVIKFFETFTDLTVKMIQILRQFYENVIITKPLLSRPSNSERYIICLNFNSKEVNELDKIYDIIIEANKQTDKYMVDIFPDYNINPDLDIYIKLSSTQMSNRQHKQINEMISYYNEGNFYGDVYRKYLKDRRDSNDFWISLFYPVNTKDLVSTRKNINKLIENKLNTVKLSIKDLQGKLQINNFEITNLKYNTESELDIESVSDSEPKAKTKAKSKAKSKAKK